LLNYPDELMIDWQNTPRGSTASIYWPQVAASSVLQLAGELYPAQPLTASDSHTIQCTVDGGMTYVPLPTGTGTNFGGLITLELPAGIRAGEEFKVIVRRVTSRRPLGKVVEDIASVGDQEINWRYIVGTFQMTIPVEKDEAILPAEENLLAILKWRQQLMAPSNRWYPVLQRYIAYVAARVKGLGGNPATINPSQYGTANQGKGLGIVIPCHRNDFEYTGKVSGLRYDRFGDFKGFLLITEAGHERAFHSHEREIEELVRTAWAERMLISVLVHREAPHWPASIVLRRTPQVCCH
jgi:hypothetical protein